MIMDSHLADLRKQRADGPFLRPDYGRECFDQIPGIIAPLLGVPQHKNSLAYAVTRQSSPAQNVVVLLIDGFGYNSWLKYCEDFPFMRAMTERGCVMPITSLFPSTTAASLTCVNSGLTPQQHGLVEWRLYMDELGYPIFTLPFTSPAMREAPDWLLSQQVNPNILFDGRTIQEGLVASGVGCFSFLHKNYATSAYSNLTHKGSSMVAYDSVADMAVKVRQRLESAKGRTYCFVYYDAVDAVAHKYGPHSGEYVAEVSGLMHLLQTELVEKLHGDAAKQTMLVATADHGHVPMDPTKVTYIFETAKEQRCLAKMRDGRPIMPWGSPRDLFLRVREEVLQETVSQLADRLAGKADVRSSRHEANRGLFGRGEEHPKFRDRIGNVLILPYEGEAVAWLDPAVGKTTKRGMHGGMSHEEMLTQIAFANLAELK